MRKLLIAIMALVMAFGLAACGGSEEVPADVQAVKDQANGNADQRKQGKPPVHDKHKNEYSHRHQGVGYDFRNDMGKRCLNRIDPLYDDILIRSRFPSIRALTIFAIKRYGRKPAVTLKIAMITLPI